MATSSPGVTAPPYCDRTAPPPKIRVRNLNFFYGRHQALFNNHLDIPEGRVTAIIGPSGCGKSTHLRTYNRIYELYPDQRADGEIWLDGHNLLSPGTDVMQLRQRLGMVFQRPVPFPLSIFDNVAFGLRGQRLPREEVADRVEGALRKAALWEEVKEVLHRPGTCLSGGQQQRLCIARAVVMEPEMLLMDEPCSAIDPVATAKIEELILDLKGKYTIIIVTHNMQQAARISDVTAYFYQGRILTVGPTVEIFREFSLLEDVPSQERLEALLARAQETQALLVS